MTITGWSLFNPKPGRASPATQGLQERERLEFLLSLLVQSHLGTRKWQLQTCAQIVLDLLESGRADTTRFNESPRLKEGYRALRGMPLEEDPEPTEGMLAFIGHLHLPAPGQVRTVQVDTLAKVGEVLQDTASILYREEAQNSDLHTLGAALPVMHHSELLRPQELLNSSRVYFDACEVYARHHQRALNLEGDPVHCLIALSRDLLKREIKLQREQQASQMDEVVVITT